MGEDKTELTVTAEIPTTVSPTALRDRIAWRLCNLILRTVATPWYRTRIDGLIRYGMASMLRDEIQGSPSPLSPEALSGRTLKQ